MLQTETLTPRREANLARWVEAAMALLVEEGLQGLTIKALARRVDRSVGALYRYFPSKDSLLVAMQERVLAGLAVDLSAVGPRDATPVEALASVMASVRVYVSLARRRPSHFQLLASVLGDPRPVLPEAEARRVFAAMVPSLGQVTLRLTAATDSGALEPGDAAERTALLWAAAQGLQTLAKLGRVEPSIKRLDSGAILIPLLRGWGADPTLLRSAWDIACTRS